MIRTTLGRLLVHVALPPEHQDLERTLDKKGLADLLTDVALKNPDKYVKISKALADIGRHVATVSGGMSFGLKHLSKAKAAIAYRTKVQDRLRQILDDDNTTEEERHDRIILAAGAGQAQLMKDVMAESLAEGNPLADQAVSGARGSPMNVSSLRGQDLLYTDHRNRVIPLPVLSSYSEGLQPFEYWAGTYGARKGVLDVKLATQKAGYLSKQLNQIAHRLMVVGEDDQRDLPQRGFPTHVDDSDNEGALLAQDTGPYKRNTPLTAKILSDLKRRGQEHILVRSPIVGGSPDGGVYSRDIGIRERGVLPGVGEPVGLTAAQALSEPLSQSQLSSKHTGGVVGQSKGVGGFDYINSLIQIPKTFRNGAAHSTVDGRVERVEDAVAGGKHVWINDAKHYVSQGFDLKVKPGDVVEAGDSISEGAANPAIITKYKGHGEGRRYFTSAMVDAMRGAGMKVHRRNVELLARGLINHVRLTEPYGDNVPDDVVPYSTFEHSYTPRDDAVVRKSRDSLGRYLEKPVLHYSIGTKLRPSVLQELDRYGVSNVLTHHEPPPFEAEMIRGMAISSHDPDWQTRMYGTGLKAGLLDSAHRGRTSDSSGTSFVPALAKGIGFGRSGVVQQPKPGQPAPPEGLPFGGDEVKQKPQALDLSMVAPKKPKTFISRMGSLFKASVDDIASLKEAEAVLESQKPFFAKFAAAQPKQPRQATPPRQIRPIRTPTQPRQTRPIKTANEMPRPGIPNLHGYPLPPNAGHVEGPEPPLRPQPQPHPFAQTPFARNPHGWAQNIEHSGLAGLTASLSPHAFNTLTRGPNQAPQPSGAAVRGAMRPGAQQGGYDMGEHTEPYYGQPAAPSQPPGPQTLIGQASEVVNRPSVQATLGGAQVLSGAAGNIAQRFPQAARFGTALSGISRFLGPLEAGRDALEAGAAYSEGGREGALDYARRSLASLQPRPLMPEREPGQPPPSMAQLAYSPLVNLGLNGLNYLSSYLNPVRNVAAIGVGASNVANAAGEVGNEAAEQVRNIRPRDAGTGPAGGPQQARGGASNANPLAPHNSMAAASREGGRMLLPNSVAQPSPATLARNEFAGVPAALANPVQGVAGAITDLSQTRGAAQELRRISSQNDAQWQDRARAALARLEPIHRRWLAAGSPPSGIVYNVPAEGYEGVQQATYSPADREVYEATRRRLAMTPRQRDNEGANRLQRLHYDWANRDFNPGWLLPTGTGFSSAPVGIPGSNSTIRPPNEWWSQGLFGRRED